MIEYPDVYKTFFEVCAIQHGRVTITFSIEKEAEQIRKDLYRFRTAICNSPDYTLQYKKLLNTVSIRVEGRTVIGEAILTANKQ